MTPLVSVVIPTWRRHRKLLEGAIPSVMRQTWGNLEIIVVSDGHDPELREKVRELPVRYYECGRNWHSVTRQSWGAEPLMLGLYAADGDYLCHLGDDDQFAPEHVEALVTALHGTSHGFALCQYLYPDGKVLGDGRIRINCCGDGMALYRPALLAQVQRRPTGYGGDCDFLSGLDAVATHAFAEKPTYLVGHKIDEYGSYED